MSGVIEGPEFDLSRSRCIVKGIVGVHGGLGFRVPGLGF